MANITKIYDIKLTGQKDLVSQMEKVNKEFDDARKRWKELKELVAKGGLTTGEMAKYKLEIQQTKVEIEKAKLAQQQLKNEGVSYTNALKMQREEERKNREEKKLSLDAYQKLAKELNENRKLLKAMDAENPQANQTQEYREQLRIVTELDNRIKAIDARAGQFQRNVGNYPKSVSISGIDTSAIKNLQDAGLGGVIASQINQAKSRVRELDTELITLKNQWNMVKSTGGQGLGEIEQKIIDNRKAVERYNSEIKRTEKSFKSVSSVAFNVTESIKKQFAGLSGQLSTFAIGFLSFQAASSIGNRTFDDAVAFDSANKSLEMISKTQEELKLNQEYINRLTEQYGVKLLDTQRSYTKFYASATEGGMDPHKAREIFENVIEAGSVLKLSQDEINGALKAFEQILSKGKVQAEELRGQIGERLPGAFAIMSKAMSVSQEELNKMMKDGNLYASDAIPKFAKKLGDTFDSGGKKVQGLQAEMNRLDNLFTKIGNNKHVVTLLSSIITLLTAIGSVIVKIPFPIIATGIGLVTSALILYRAEQIRSYVATQIATKEGLIYRAYLIAQSVAQNVAAAATRIATYEIILFNGALRVTPLGWFLSILALLISALVIASDKFGVTTKQINNAAKAQKDLNEATKEGIKNAASEISQLEKLYKTATDTTKSYKERKVAVDELQKTYPSYFANISDEIIMNGKAQSSYLSLRDAIIAASKAKAAQVKVDEINSKYLESEVEIKNKMKQAVLDARNPQEIELLGTGYGESDRGRKKLSKEEAKKLAEARFKNETENLKNLYKQRNQELAPYIGYVENNEKIAGKYLEDKKNEYSNSGSGSGGDGKPKRDKPYRGSRLTGSQKDYLKDLEADKNEELAILKKKFIEGVILEDEFIKKSLAVNIAYHDKKIAYLKKGNAEERKQEAQAQLDKINDISEANDKLYSLYKKRYDDKQKNSESAAKSKRDKVMDDPYSSDNDKLNAEKTYQEESLQAQQIYNLDMLNLEQELSKNMIEEMNDRQRKLQEKIDEKNRNDLKDPIKRVQNNFKIIDDVYDEISNQNQINNALEKTNILKNKNLTTEQKKIELERLSAKLEIQNINTELGLTISKIKAFEVEIEKRKLTNDELREYNRLLKEKAILEGQKAEAEQNSNWSSYTAPTPSSENTMSAIKGGIIKNFGKDGKISIGKNKEGQDIDGSELLGNIIAQSFDLASQAMNNYFEAERAAVERSKQVAYERIDLEKQQLLRTAQSAAERDSIEKQAAEKKKKADKEAGERLKKIKKQELKIALATQLANIGVAAAQNPLNGVTFGAAGIAMYAVLAGLALAQYAMNLGALNNTQFAKGGIFKRFFARGGKLKGPSHLNGGIPAIDPNTGQKVAEFEGEEGIINKNSMRDNNVYSVTGTPSQIASRINAVGGGVDWDGGATLKRFMNGGTFLGSNLRPPVFRSYFENQQNSQNNNNNSEEIAELKKMIADLAKMQKMESSKKVVLNPHDVSSYQNEYNKQTEIATL